MNNPVRPSSYFTGGIAASAPSGVLATIPNPPPEITRLPAGTTLRGVVLGDDGKGHALIRTDLGLLSVATKAHLAKDSEVVLQLRSSGAHLHILVMQARGQTAPVAAPPPPPPATPQGAPSDIGAGAQTAGTQAAATQPGPPAPQGGPLLPFAGHADLLSLGQTVKAVIQVPAGALPGAGGSPLPPGAALAAGLPEALARLAPGTVLPLRILSVSGPAAAPGPPAPVSPGPGPAGPQAAGTPPAQVLQHAPGGSPAAPATVTAQAPHPPSAGPGAAPGAPPGPPSGQAGPAASAGAAGGGTGPAAVPQGPGGPAGAPQVPAAAPVQSGPTAPLTFNGQVTGVTHAGRPVLSTPLGTLILEVEARMPAGSRLALELSPGALPRGGEAASRPSMPGSLVHTWPALEQALAALSEPAGGAGATQGAPPGVPQPGPRLASGILFFLAALSGGDLGRWLGTEALQTLRSLGRESLIGRLSRDLAQMGRMAEGVGGTGGSGSAGSDWRLLPIPLWDGDQVRQLRLYLRQHEKRHDEAKRRDRRDTTRFILELEMSRLGEMQLDGLVRDKRFDLVMRTRAALPEAMRREIRQIFEDANQAAGYTGNLGFQASADWRFLPVEPAREAGGLLV